MKPAATCACGEQLTKPKRGPSPARCDACKRNHRAARERERRRTRKRPRETADRVQRGLKPRADGNTKRMLAQLRSQPSEDRFWRKAIAADLVSYGEPGSTPVPPSCLKALDNHEARRAAHIEQQHEQALLEDSKRNAVPAILILVSSDIPDDVTAELDEMLALEVAA